MKSIELTIPKNIKKGWEQSPIKSLIKQSGQFKNKVGTKIVEEVLKERKISYTVTKTGFVIFNGKNTSEIRTSFATFHQNKKTFWFNQIRPNINNWSHIHLVCVHPEKIEVYQFSKEECLSLCEDTSGLDHVGQEGDLLAIQVTTESDYWKLDCYGKLLAEIPTTKIKILNE